MRIPSALVPFILPPIVIVLFAAPPSALGQAGLRESLERLDINENGLIEPDEITPLARPYLERIAKNSRARLDRPTEIHVFQEAARIYHAFQNGIAGFRVSPKSESIVKEFGADDGEPVVPEFGLAEIKYPYTQDDLDEADRTLYYYDRNRDGFLDVQESRRVRWTHRNPFDDDFNEDSRLSRMELAQRYARRRLVQNDSQELFRQAYRNGGIVRPETETGRDDSDQWWRQGGNAFWLTSSMMSRFDANKNGRLEASEAQNLRLPIGQIDLDNDGEISRDELFAMTRQLQAEAGDVTEGLPGWFFERDKDEDGQIAIHEYATDWTAQQLEEFAAFDLNDDKLLTSSEVLRAKAAVGGTYNNESAEILPPQRTIISEIEIEDDYVIRDLNVQISITHTSVGGLDAYLTSPDGTRVELFAGVGGSGDHFERTIFDNEASGQPIFKSRPPFEGSYRPSEKDKGKPGLEAFYGKSVQGVWQLVIRGTRSDRFGMLHSWGMAIRPEEDLPGLTSTFPNAESLSDEGDDEAEKGSRGDGEGDGSKKRGSSSDSSRTRKFDFSDPEVRAKIEAWKKAQAEGRSAEKPPK